MKIQDTRYKAQTNLKSQISITKRFGIWNLVIVSCLFLVTWLLFLAVSAANAQENSEVSLSLSPPTGVYATGDIFTVDVLLNTAGRDISAAEGVISFDPEALTVTDVSYEDSVFNSWIINPDFSNTRGRVEFAGTSSEGIRDADGKILTISFRGLTEGVTKARFSSGAVLSADGKGSNILTSLLSGAYTLTTKVSQVSPEPVYIPPFNAPAAPVISSSTHPNQDAWYTENNVDVFWNVPYDITAVRMLVDKEPRTIPTNYYPYALVERSIKNLDDGIWYFHLQMRNAYGWGGISHFKIQIDSQAPQYLRVRELSRTDAADPVVRLVFDSFDAGSGVEKYEVQITGRDSEVWREDGNQIHQTPPLEPGKYSIIAKAIDRAGNYTVDATDFEVVPLQAPVFKEYTEVLTSGNALVLSGISYPNSEITIWTKPENKQATSHKVESDTEGSFTYVAPETPEDGVYEIWASVKDKRGAASGNSKTITIAVKQPTLIYLSSIAADTVNSLIPLTALVFLLAVMVIYMRHKFILFRTNLQKEVEDVEIALHRAFYTLRKETDKNIKILEMAKGKRTLTREELSIMDGLKGKLSKVERMVEKEVEDVENALDIKKMKQEDSKKQTLDIQKGEED